jgi:preprotein translocase subunit SecG
MFIALVVLHVLVSIFLVLVVLLQAGRGAELGAAFGGLGQATYGRTPTTPLAKLTTGLAVVFMVTSLTLAFIANERPTESALSPSAMAPQSGPAAPGGTPPAAPATAPAPAAPAQTAAPAAPAPPAAPTAPVLPQTDAPARK